MTMGGYAPPPQRYPSYTHPSHPSYQQSAQYGHSSLGTGVTQTGAQSSQYSAPPSYMYPSASQFGQDQTSGKDSLV
jgi:hypothetical protein